MAEKIIMPKQGLQMTAGLITKWLKSEGEQVAIGDPLFIMETDKLTITIDASQEGTLLKIVRGEGEEVPITETIAYLGEPGEVVEDDSPAKEEQKEAKPAEEIIQAQAPVKKKSGKGMKISPRARKLAEENGVDIEKLEVPEGRVRIQEKDVQAYINAMPKATPTAAKAMKAQGIDAQSVQGTGVGGKIVLADLDTKEPQEGDLIPLTGMRRVIADRMSESLREIAQTQHRMHVDVSKLVEIRKELKELGHSVSYNDILIKFVAFALKAFPLMNASFTDEGIRLHPQVNIGMAVSVEGGLVVPVIKNADSIGLDDIHDQSADLASRARTNQLTMDEFTGGTFTVSNLGMFDVDDFIAIINPPEAGILAVGKIDKRVVVENDTMVIKPMMTLTLSYDHRVVDGAEAAKFLKYIKTLIEIPSVALMGSR